MGTLVGRWLRANRDKIDNINFYKGEFYKVEEVTGLGYCRLINGTIVKVDIPNWTIMPENFHPNDPKDLTGRYLLCVQNNNWSNGKGRPSIGEHVMINGGSLGEIGNISVQDLEGRTDKMSKDRLFGLNPEYKLMARGFYPNKVDVKTQPLTPDECYPAGMDYPIGCSITKGNNNIPHKVIGKDNSGVVISTDGTVGFRITDSHCKYYSINPTYTGEQAEFLPYSFIKLFTSWDVSNVPTISDVIQSKGCSSLQDFENPLHSSKWEFPKGSIVDYGDKSYRVIGKSDNFPDRYLLLSNSRGTEGTLIKPDWLEVFHIDHVYVGKYGIWVYKQKLSFTKDRPENKHELAKGFENCTSFQDNSGSMSFSSLQEKTSLEDDPVTRKVKPPKFQHKRTAY